MYYLSRLWKISSPCFRHCLIDGSSYKQLSRRHLAFVSNKRITRLSSEIEVNKSELNEDGNEKYIDVRLKNRNPRNLEQMLFEPKPMGYEMDEENRHYWNKVVLEKRSKCLIGKIVHHSGRTTVSAATNEPSIATFLGSKSAYTDVKAAKILGQVLAMRALESGVHSAFYDYREQRKSGEKLSSFIHALRQNGLNLDEQPVIFARAQQRRRLKARWVNIEKMKLISNSLSLNSAIFIVTDRFDKEIIEYFQDKFRIIGPLVITYCDEDICQSPEQTLPKRIWPIFSQCMRGMEVTTSNLTADRKKLVENRVRMMSGNYYENYHGITNVIVSDSVLTRKTRAAAENKIPIVTFEWIESCWTKYQYEHRRADEEAILAKYKLPIFFGLNVVLSGVSERDRIGNTIESNGGKYHAALKLKPLLPNTILLVPRKLGEKYSNAKRLHIPCLLPKWLDDSIQAGYALPFEQYDIENLIDEDDEETSTVPDKKGVFNKEESTEWNDQLQSILDEIIQSNVYKEQLFDGHSIHATGFDRSLLVMIENCAKKFGAFFYNSLCDSVTDVIVGPDIGELSLGKLLKSEFGGHRLVTIHWFIDCIRSFKLCSQSDYRIHLHSELRRPLSKCTTNANMGMLKELDRLIFVPDPDEEMIDEKKPQHLHSLLANETDNDFFFSDPEETDTPDDCENSSKRSRTVSPNDDDDEASTLNSYADQSCTFSTINDQIRTTNTSAVFMFSSFDNESKTKWTNLSQDVLNIIVNNDETFSNEVTHLILNRPRCSEKVFSAIAAGAFILKPEYIYDSILAKKLLPEPNYQWGRMNSNDSDETSNRQSGLNEDRLMRVAIQWKDRIDESNRKIFQDLKILLLNPMMDDDHDSHLNSCANIVRAGGGRVFSIADLIVESHNDGNLDEMIEGMDLAIVNPTWKEKPTLQRSPKDADLQALRRRYSISNVDIRNFLAKFY
ncbi:hypothetical protein BLA29_000303 [Euroglyphus maynei]|uniref:BRCT domain-containing protein n=1 Tax=Euroglyphus maynei TaxID=6958 RepID=A0A1Y3BPC8_EURMA|nr:hypothetical protein BLA29_000303 [Euroglyphus maynei]